jgi:hypothetical protein
MISLRSLRIVPPFLLALILSSCSSLRIEQVDFGWPVESALAVSDRNTVDESRYALSMNVAALAEAEFQDTAALKGTTLRVLRSTNGLYYVTGKGFAHVYVFSAGESSLEQEAAIAVTPESEGGRRGLRNPALNQRPPHVELLDEGSPAMLLSADGIVSGGPEGGNAQ